MSATMKQVLVTRLRMSRCRAAVSDVISVIGFGLVFRFVRQSRQTHRREENTMTPEVAIDVVSEAIYLILLLVSLILVPGLIVGLIVSVFQAATQINEMTLSFIPKLLITVGVLIFAGPYIIRLLTDYTTRLYESIPGYIG